MLSFVIPAYNEEASLGHTIADIRRALAELREETGYSCGRVIYLGKSAKGKYVTGYAHYFLGLDAVRAGDQELEEAEEIDVVLLNLKKFKKILMEHSFLDVFTEVCAWRALKYLKKI